MTNELPFLVAIVIDPGRHHQVRRSDRAAVRLTSGAGMWFRWRSKRVAVSALALPRLFTGRAALAGGDRRLPDPSPRADRLASERGATEDPHGRTRSPTGRAPQSNPANPQPKSQPMSDITEIEAPSRGRRRRCRRASRRGRRRTVRGAHAPPAKAIAALGLTRMSLQELKEKSPADLLAFAEQLEIENANSMRKQDMMFAILKTSAEEGVEIFGSGTLEVRAGRLRLPAQPGGQLPARPGRHLRQPLADPPVRPAHRRHRRRRRSARRAKASAISP